MKWHFLAACLIAFTMLIAHHAHARDAAFMAPGASFANKPVGAISVEPSNEIKVGDTQIALGRRATFFFANQTNSPVNVLSVEATGDTNVKAEIVGDDCSSQKTIRPGNRCSVTVEATPTDGGSWTAELLLTHNAQGRIARAKMSGKTSAKATQRKDMGLALSSKKIEPVDFETVEVGVDKAVRSALMVNDSHTPITILDISVIAPENGLEMTEEGCSIDMELDVGESCPVTLIWQPTARGIISTDLIIRHTGRLGFAVIPIRGKAKGDGNTKTASRGSSSRSMSNGTNSEAASSSRPMGLDRSSVTRHSGGGSDRIPRLTNSSADAVLKELSSGGLSVGAEELTMDMIDLDGFYLIGTVGSRGLIYKPDGRTVMVSEYDTISIDGAEIEVKSISPKEAVLEYMGGTKVLKLTSATSLKERIKRKKKQKEMDENIDNQKGKGASGARSNVVKLPVQK